MSVFRHSGSFFSPAPYAGIAFKHKRRWSTPGASVVERGQGVGFDSELRACSGSHCFALRTLAPSSAS